MPYSIHYRLSAGAAVELPGGIGPSKAPVVLCDGARVTCHTEALTDAIVAAGEILGAGSVAEVTIRYEEEPKERRPADKVGQRPGGR